MKLFPLWGATVPDIDSDGPQGMGGSTGVKLLPPPSQPMQVARAFVARCCNHDGTLTIAPLARRMVVLAQDALG
jgi:hypothetical protein